MRLPLLVLLALALPLALSGGAVADDFEASCIKVGMNGSVAITPFRCIPPIERSAGPASTPDLSSVLLLP